MSIQEQNKQLARDYFRAFLDRDFMLIEHWAQLDDMGLSRQPGVISI